MTQLEPIFAYLATLAVIQPGRVQDIEANVARVFGPAADEILRSGILREVHEVARARGLVIAVKRGVYFLSRSGVDLARTRPVAHQLDNRRLFLLKKRRRRIM
jgi:hypothetical protein